MSQPNTSSYTTTLNCIEIDYPFCESIQSLLGFSNKVVVVDGGNHDRTIEALGQMARAESSLNALVEPVECTLPNSAYHQDSLLKGRARHGCTADYCCQNDNEEIVIEDDSERIRQLLATMQDHQSIILPVVEFWIENSARNSMMLDKSWSEVTAQDIVSKVHELSELGLRFFHEKSSKDQTELPLQRHASNTPQSTITNPGVV